MTWDCDSPHTSASIVCERSHVESTSLASFQLISPSPLIDKTGYIVTVSLLLYQGIIHLNLLPSPHSSTCPLQPPAQPPPTKRWATATVTTTAPTLVVSSAPPSSSDLADADPCDLKWNDREEVYECVFCRMQVEH